MGAKVSVILPLYNVADYVGACIASLEVQTLRDCEFIFVDDCSTDGSLAVVEEFATRDERVRIVRQETNQGPGVARNAGIEHAHGAWLSFVDPDDWIEPDFLELLHSKGEATGAIIVKGTTVCTDEFMGKKDVWWAGLNQRITEELDRGLPLYASHFFDHYSALYRACLFEDGTVRYGTTRNGEDTTFLLRVCSVVKHVVFEDTARYHYRLNRQNSATQTYTAQRILNELDALAEKIMVWSGRRLDEHGTDYLVKRVSMCTRSYVAFARGPEADRIPEDVYVTRLREILCSLDGYERLGKASPELNALFLYGRVIPLRSVDTSRLNIDRVRRWVDLMTDVPDARRTLTSGFVAAVISTVVAYRLNPERDEADRNYLGSMRRELDRLDAPYRARVVACMPFAFAGMSATVIADRCVTAARGCLRRKRDGGEI